MICRNSGSSVAALQQHDERAGADAAHADDLARPVDDLEPLEQVPGDPAAGCAGTPRTPGGSPPRSPRGPTPYVAYSSRRGTTTGGALAMRRTPSTTSVSLERAWRLVRECALWLLRLPWPLGILGGRRSFSFVPCRPSPCRGCPCCTEAGWAAVVVAELFGLADAWSGARETYCSGFTNNGEGGITQGATENIFSISNATSKVVGQPQLPLWHPGTVEKVRPSHRGASAWNLRVQRAVLREPRCRLPAWVLLDVHRCFRKLAIDLQLVHLRALHRRRVERLAQNDAAARTALGISRAVGRKERPRRRVRSSEREDRLSPGANEPAAATRSAREQPGRFLRSRHHGAGPEQLWTASRRRLQPGRPHRRAQRLRHLL